MKIYVKYSNKTLPHLRNTKKGDWIDLSVAETITLIGPRTVKGAESTNVYNRFVSLGIAM